MAGEAMLVKRLSAAAVLPQRGSAATRPDLVDRLKAVLGDSLVCSKSRQQLALTCRLQKRR